MTYGAEAELSVFDVAGFHGFVLNRKRGDEFTAKIDGKINEIKAERDSSGAVAFFRVASGKDPELLIKRSTRCPWTAHEVIFPSKGVDMAGTEYSPSVKKKRLPAIVIVHGSGYSDRDSPYYQKLAFTLVNLGFVVLLPDKRGSGRSGGDWRQADFNELADDALAGLDALRADPAVDRNRVGLLGMSQGGWIVPLAASKNPEVRFVVDLSGTSVRPEEQVIHEVTEDLRGRGIREPDVQRIVELHQLLFDYFGTGGHEQAQAYIDEYDQLSKTNLADIVKEFPRDPYGPDIQWARKIYGFDPLVLWQHLRCPSLIVFGAEDEKHLIPVSESVARLKKIGANEPRSKLTVKTIAGTGHTLGNQSGTDFHPELKSTLSRWLQRNTGAHSIQ